MTGSQRLKILIESQRTVFTPVDLQALWKESELSAKTNAVRMVERGVLIRIAKGYYAINDRYNELELANRIVSPSYVSFQTALFNAGVSFQERGQIDCAAGFNYTKKIGSRVIVYYSIKRSLLFNIEGVRNRDGISIASPERAVLDCLYLGFLPDIDNPDKINRLSLDRLSAIYPKTVQKKAKGIL